MAGDFVLIAAAGMLFSQEGGLSYGEAYRLAVAEGRPLVLLIGAEWCPACVVMERKVVPRLKNQGAFSKVAFAVVDFDREQSLGQKLIGNGPLPQMLFYRRTPLGWRLTRLIGLQDAGVVEKTLARVVGPNIASQTAQSDFQNKPTEAASVSSSSPDVTSSDLGQGVVSSGKVATQGRQGRMAQ